MKGAVLTTIVQPDPVYVDFDVDERAILTVKAARAAEGKHARYGRRVGGEDSDRSWPGDRARLPA